MKSLLCLALLLFASISYAQLGKSEAECDAKYGPALKRDEIVDGKTVKMDRRVLENGTVVKDYKYGKFKLTANFFNDKCYDLGYFSGVKDEDIQALLDENAQGSTWEKTHEDKKGKGWKRADGNALAIRGDKNGIQIDNTALAPNAAK